ncbi:phosphoglycerate kinase [Lactonifactor longoviformis]|uniref:Phosphoglycerate kinase n=1 Tax=Lactonifactor longoviformis DSM 17459 TaxID=1122155 RepID=A0A1M4SXW6_9CLOT|nr:phosphoglycerate kinase [Lactonifactor longoviformis]POP32821.1 phosphoglycerate kinase [Lactonifactor longoviformis]SHE37076.1 phosphoglycerate kinase [Lactonifactor longoviformis DSM 17459]
MRYGIHTIDDFTLDGKTVLYRADMNQPVNREEGRLESCSRIRACIPTIRELLDRNAKVVILIHQGSDIEYHNFFTTKPHRDVLEKLLERPVGFPEDVCGPAARDAVRQLQPGEVLLLDNVRFLAQEQTLFENALKLSFGEQASTLLVEKLAPLGDLYVCDAFAAAHRSQPSLCGFELVMPSAMGRLFEKEYCRLSELMESPKRPCTFILGGAKVSDAFGVMEEVLRKKTADRILTGGVTANLLLAAAGISIGEKSREYISTHGYERYYDVSRRLLGTYRDQISLPLDAAWAEDGKRAEGEVKAVPSGAGIFDIGRETAAEYSRMIQSSSTIFINGPMGVFEREEFSLGTRKVWEALAGTGGETILGGGDSIAAAERFCEVEQFSYVSTGGGALIRFLSGEELPVIQALRYGAELFAGDYNYEDRA